MIQNFFEAEWEGDHQGGFNTLGYSSLTYMKPTYQILAPAVPRTCKKFSVVVVGGGLEFRFSGFKEKYSKHLVSFLITLK